MVSSEDDGDESEVPESCPRIVDSGGSSNALEWGENREKSLLSFMELFFSLRVGEGQHHFIYANMSVNIFYYSSSLGVKANQSNRTLDPVSVP